MPIVFLTLFLALPPTHVELYPAIFIQIYLYYIPLLYKILSSWCSFYVVCLRVSLTFTWQSRLRPRKRSVNAIDFPVASCPYLQIFKKRSDHIRFSFTCMTLRLQISNQQVKLTAMYKEAISYKTSCSVMFNSGCDFCKSKTRSKKHGILSFPMNENEFHIE